MGWFAPAQQRRRERRCWKQEAAQRGRRSEQGRKPHMASKKKAPRKTALSRVATICLDLAKSSIDFAGLDAAGQVVTRRR